MTPAFTFFVHGHPETQGSMRGFVRGKRAIVTSDNAKLKPWRAAIADTARAHGWGSELLDGPIAVGLVFIFQRPDSHFGKRGLKPSAPAFPCKGHDLDKLTRAAGDALTGICWTNDARIVVLAPRQFFGCSEGAFVVVHPIVDVEPGAADVTAADFERTPDDVARKLLAWWPRGSAVDAFDKVQKVSPRTGEQLSKEMQLGPCVEVGEASAHVDVVPFFSALPSARRALHRGEAEQPVRRYVERFR